MFMMYSAGNEVRKIKNLENENFIVEMPNEIRIN